MTSLKTGVELYIKAMLRTHGLGSLPLIYIRKAKVLVDTKLNDPCCPGGTGDPVDLLTAKPNNFTDTVRAMLDITPKRGNLQSLKRVQSLLQRRLDCCQIVT